MLRGDARISENRRLHLRHDRCLWVSRARSRAIASRSNGVAGETGVRSVQCLSGNDVWKAMDERMFDPELFSAGP